MMDDLRKRDERLRACMTRIGNTEEGEVLKEWLCRQLEVVVPPGPLERMAYAEGRRAMCRLILELLRHDKAQFRK